MKVSKAELLKQVMAEDVSILANQDKCAGAKSDVRAACKKVNKPVDDPEFPKECSDALDQLSDCMEKYY